MLCAAGLCLEYEELFLKYIRIYIYVYRWSRERKNKRGRAVNNGEKKKTKKKLERKKHGHWKTDPWTSSVSRWSCLPLCECAICWYKCQSEANLLLLMTWVLDLYQLEYIARCDIIRTSCWCRFTLLIFLLLLFYFFVQKCIKIFFWTFMGINAQKIRRCALWWCVSVVRWFLYLRCTCYLYIAYIYV